MKALITGATGFIGRFLAKHCLERGCVVLGLDIQSPTEEWPAAPFEHCDIRSSRRLLDLIKAFRPDRIFHLAAQSYPTVSLTQPYNTMDINAGGTITLFECLRTAGLMPMVVVACSSAEYGPVSSTDLPVRETHPLHPLHPYGVSKVAQDLLAAQYFMNYSIPCVRIRLFNTTGPSKLGDVCSDLIQRAVQIELGVRRPLLPIGNLASRRTISDVRDTANALWLSAEYCQPGEVYNVGGDRIYSVHELLERIRALVGVTCELVEDRKLMRGYDEPVIAGDIQKFQRCTGWKPQIELVQTLQDIVEWWRRRLTQVPVTTAKRFLTAGGAVEKSVGRTVTKFGGFTGNTGASHSCQGKDHIIGRRKEDAGLE
jgi:GDP-4-dehydro-6-deoxy-D-mannose reductase